MPLHYIAQVNGGKLVIKSGGEHSFPKSLSPIMETLSAYDGGVVLNEGDSITGNLYDDDLDSSKPENSDLRIMSCNILAEFESWSGDPEVEMPYLPVDLRKEIFFAALNYYQPTVIGFQEMTPNWYAAAEEYDTEDVWEILKFANPNRNDGEYVFSTVMYRKDLYTLLDSGMRFYSKFKNGRSGCYTWAVLKDNASGKEFCFLSTHWDGTGRPNGFLQAEELAAFVNEMKKSYPVFTTGDFNSNEISPELIQYLEDCDIVDAKQAAINRVNDVGSWHNFLQTNLSWGSCDHITATKDTTVLKFQTLYKNELIYCSDHCWLIADIKFN
jgi:endonuclease/exonuclease/phosphatase family metal-dependent hydrolase